MAECVGLLPWRPQKWRPVIDTKRHQYMVINKQDKTCYCFFITIAPETCCVCTVNISVTTKRGVIIKNINLKFCYICFTYYLVNYM